MPAPETSMGSLLLTGLFGLIGALLGGFIQYSVSSSLEGEKQRMQIELSAYADFAKAQAALQRAELQEADDSKKKAATDDANLKIRDAAFRIVIFSPAKVVKAWAAFTSETHHEECGRTPTEADLAVYQEIRQQNQTEVGLAALRRRLKQGAEVSNEDVAMALFGCKLK